MSKERDLLKKILATGWLNNTISCEVDDLLTEPEPEPLSNLAIKEAGRNAKDMSFYNGVRWAEAQHGITRVDDE